MQTWVNQLKKEYAKGKQALEKYRASLTDGQNGQTEAEEIAIVDGMISDMQYAIEWMRAGRRPNSSRGVDIKDAYSRSILMDMDLLPAAVTEEQETRVTLEQKKALVQILMRMSTRERQCYLLHLVEGMSLSEIGKELKLTKRTVQQYVERAKSKVGQAV